MSDSVYDPYGNRYIKLLHGRDDPNQDMKDWGFNGPVLGPFEAVHFTYCVHVRCIWDSRTGDELELGFTDDMLTYEGKYYGDFEIAASFGSDTPATSSAGVTRGALIPSVPFHCKEEHMSKPTHIAYVISDPKEGSERKAMWREIGAVWPHKSGNGFDVVIYDQLSVSGRIVCTERKEKAVE